MRYALRLRLHDVFAVTYLNGEVFGTRFLGQIVCKPDYTLPGCILAVPSTTKGE